jgi:hypothetical protein
MYLLEGRAAEKHRGYRRQISANAKAGGNSKPGVAQISAVFWTHPAKSSN